MTAKWICEAVPVLEKASPLIAELLGTPIASVIISLLGAIVNCDPTDHPQLVKKLNQDPDLYAKLTNLEATHKKWLGGSSTE